MEKQYNIIVGEPGTNVERKYIVKLKRKTGEKETISDDDDQKYDTDSMSLYPVKNDPNLCWEIALTEYEHCIRRSERLDNKIYILLTVCGFIFVLLTGVIQEMSTLKWAKNTLEMIVITFYFILVLMATIAFVFLLAWLIRALSSIRLIRFDSTEVLERNMTHVDSAQVSKYVVALYEKARSHNNEQIDKRYKIVNRCVRILIFVVVILIFASAVRTTLPTANDKGRFFAHVYGMRYKANDVKK